MTSLIKPSKSEVPGSSGKPKYSTVSEMIPFLDFAQFLQKVSDSTTAKDKIKRLSNYFTHFREKYKDIHGTLRAEDIQNGDSIFSLVRLLLPNHDRTRAAYKIKAAVLGRMYGEIIGLDKKSKDGMKLLNYKDPGKAGSAAGDLATILFAVLEKRFTHVAADGPKLSELHAVLDQLARTKDGDEDPVTQKLQIKILQSFFQRLSPIEGKWLTRIILKVVAIGISQAQVLNAIHPNAKEMIKTTGLDQVCVKLNDPAAVITGASSSISLFSFFHPMLCLRLNNLSDEDPTPDSPVQSPGHSKSSPRKKDTVTLPPPPFLVETKWDGERFQIHYQFDSATGNQKFKYFSRQGHDYTSSFESLTSELQKQIVQDPPVESFILDGEMMAWQKDTKSFILKGGNIDVKKILPSNSTYCPLFMAFDIVFYNGEVVVEKPLTERMNILRQVLQPKEGVCQFSEQKLINSTSAVEDALNEAIDNKEEGLVVKDLSSTYRPGERISTWLKIKPEYVGDSSVSDLDLLIIGAYYTDSVRGGKITHVLAGLIQHNEFYALVKLGSGQLAKREMAELISELQPQFVKTEFPGVKLGGRKRPDFFIDPRKSIVVQVKATEILGNDNRDREFNYTLRFGRITKIRRDKPWHDAMSVKDFHQLRVSCEGKLAKRTDGLGRSPIQKPQNKSAISRRKSLSDSESEEPIPSSSRGKMSSPKKLGSPFRAKAIASCSSSTSTNFPKKQKVSSVLSGKVFNVVGSLTWKDEMELKIRSNGGEIVQNPTSDTFCVIAEKESLRVKNIISRGTYDVVKNSWIEECIESKRLIQFQPHYMFYSKPETQSSFAEEFDEFGDSFTVNTSLQEFKNLMESIIEKSVRNEPPPSEEGMEAIRAEVDEEVFGPAGKVQKWSFFSDCKIAFRDKPDIFLVTQIEFYGGEVAKDECEDGVTHVILDSLDSPRKKHLSAFVVKPQWLTDCLEKKELISEMRYT